MAVFFGARLVISLFECTIHMSNLLKSKIIDHRTTIVYVGTIFTCDAQNANSHALSPLLPQPGVPVHQRRSRTKQTQITFV
jgi:hypothetical protein